MEVKDMELFEIERALDDAGIYEGTNFFSLAATPEKVKELGYKTLGKAILSTNCLDVWFRHAGQSKRSTYGRSLLGWSAFEKTMQKYGLSNDDISIVYKGFIVNFDGDNSEAIRKWSHLLGRSKKEWGTSPLDKSMWRFLQNTHFLAVGFPCILCALFFHKGIDLYA